MKKIPYGIDDFERIIRQDYYYIDKTRYIKLVEDQSSYILFVRPRRMGKSLFVNMMMSYYDIAKKESFANLFGDLWIGRNPTPEANSYLVLKFDFSKINYHAEELSKNFDAYCMGRLEDFFDRYSEYFTIEQKSRVLNKSSIKDALNSLIDITRLIEKPTYLFIDEYDNFSNIVLTARGVRAHEEITHGEGFYRNFFKACKGSFDRIFMSGVTPVTYDDLTSGFNIADVVSLNPSFDQTVGVSETELRELIEYYRAEGRITLGVDDIIKEIKPWYNNFCFSNQCYDIEPPLYNTDMVMRYVKSLVVNGRPPQELLDTNARTDYNKLNYLVIAEDLDNRERRIEIIRDICARGFTTGVVHEQFPASQCGDEVNFKSMLYYFGTLTFGGRDALGNTILRVPNKTMGELYLQYMLMIVNQQGYNINACWSELQRLVGEAAVYHRWQPLFDKIGEIHREYTSLRNLKGGEYDIQGFMRGLLCLNKYYDIWPELELGNGYCDILLIPKRSELCPTKYSYLIEIKYMKAGETDTDAYIEEACKQLDRYAADKHLYGSPLLCGTPLTKVYLVFKGKELIAKGEHK